MRKESTRRWNEDQSPLSSALTSGEMPGQVARALAAVDGVGEVSVELVWSPPWTPDRMSDDAKLALDFWSNKDSK